MTTFQRGDVVHDADMGLGIVDGLDRNDDPEFGNVYRVTGVPRQSDEPFWLAREGLLALVTRKSFEPTTNQGSHP